MTPKIRAGVLGATGRIGQQFIDLLANHPLFELSTVAASSSSAGKSYANACHWMISDDIPEIAVDLVVQECTPGLECDLVFSALPADQADTVEIDFANAGYPVFTNASSHRMRKDVPLLIPEVNPDHLSVLSIRNCSNEKKGYIVANPNCSAAVLVTALAPLHEAFRIKSVIVHTMQAISGAGYPGISALDLLDNVIPFVPNEEEKMALETKKMLGSFLDGQFHEAEIRFSAHCNRVSTRDGHLETVSVGFHRSPTEQEILEVWQDWRPLPQCLNLPTAPEFPIRVRSERDRPQTLLDRNAGNGMTVTVGRLRPCEVLDFKFVALGHNAIRGAAGGSVLNAELAHAKGFLGLS
jgi:aspartate-semialdehyde dehydrogenase